jgi:hypothetical protein
MLGFELGWPLGLLLAEGLLDGPADGWSLGLVLVDGISDGAADGR